MSAITTNTTNIIRLDSIGIDNPPDDHTQERMRVVTSVLIDVFSILLIVMSLYCLYSFLRGYFRRSRLEMLLYLMLSCCS